MYAQVYTCVHSCAGQRLMSGIFPVSVITFLFWGNVTHWIWSLLLWQGCSAAELQGSACLAVLLPKSGLTGLCLTFHVGPGDSHSGLTAFIVGTLPTEPSLQPPIVLFLKRKWAPPPQIFKRLFLEVQPIMWLYGTRSGLSWIRPLNTKASLSFRTPVLHCFATGIVQGWHIAVSLFRDYPWLESQFKVMSLGGAIYLSWLANMKKKVLVSTWEHSWGLSSCHFCLHIIGWGLASLHHNQPVSSHPNSFTHLLMLNSVTHSN